jgi:hypothetical protein
VIKLRIGALIGFVICCLLITSQSYALTIDIIQPISPQPPQQDSKRGKAAQNPKKIKPSKQSAPVKNETFNFAAAIPGIFKEKIRGYEYSYMLTPLGGGQDSFPLLSQSGFSSESNFFSFARLNVNVIKNVSVKEIDKYAWVVGFSDLYDKVKNHDIYQLQAEKGEIVNSLLAAHRQYADEYARYLRALFIFDIDRINIDERNYNLDKEELTLQGVAFAKHMLPPCRSCAHDDPQDTVMASFRNQGMRLAGNQGGVFYSNMTVRVPLGVAKSFFDQSQGQVGRRTGTGALTYWVIPTYQYLGVNGVRLQMTGLRLIKAELTLDGIGHKITLFKVN